MLEHFYAHEKKRVWLERNYLASFIEEAARHYVVMNYPSRYAKGCLMHMAYFGDWLVGRHIPVDKVSSEHCREYLEQYIPPKFRHSPRLASRHADRSVLAAIRFILSLIRKRYSLESIDTPAQVEADKYADHLRRDRGLCEGTIEHHERCIGEFLRHSFGDGPIDITQITAERIHAYVAGLSPGGTNAKRRSVCTALRGYFRFLELQGLETRHLGTIVPQVASARPALSPRLLDEPELNNLLTCIDRSTDTGKRDYAAILCMCDLGLRVGDLPRMKLDDIDWRESSLLVANHKRNRPYRLPLPERLGQAMADYLAHGRPASPFRQIFLRHGRPVGHPITAQAIKTAVNRLWDKSGQHDQFSGTHILRHSAAARMKREGIALKSIADVLGHSSMQTTVIYAQVDLPVLRTVAQPWPEVEA